ADRPRPGGDRAAPATRQRAGGAAPGPQPALRNPREREKGDGADPRGGRSRRGGRGASEPRGRLNGIGKPAATAGSRLVHAATARPIPSRATAAGAAAFAILRSTPTHRGRSRGINSPRGRSACRSRTAAPRGGG